MWECNTKEICPYLDSEICGLHAGRPKFKSYHVEEEQKQREECYLQHVILCCKEWEEKKKVFIGPITRRIAALSALKVDRDLIVDLETGLKVSVIHHDIGKLAKEYQEGNWYRHEVVGAYMVYNILSDYLTDEKPHGNLLCALLSAAVYLHHEAIQLAHNWSELRSPTFEYLIAKIGPLSFNFEEEAHRFFECANEIGELNIKYKLPKKIEGGKIVSTVGRFVSLLDGMPLVNAARLCLASIILLINEVDNRAAERGRILCTSI